MMEKNKLQTAKMEKEIIQKYSCFAPRQSLTIGHCFQYSDMAA